MLTRRTALGGLLGFGAGLGGFAPGRGHAQSFPTRAVTVVVPYPAGGPVDLVARLYAEEAAADLGQPVTVDNRGGGSGSIGTVAVARADPGRPHAGARHQPDPCHQPEPAEELPL